MGRCEQAAMQEIVAALWVGREQPVQGLRARNPSSTSGSSITSNKDRAGRWVLALVTKVFQQSIGFIER